MKLVQLNIWQGKILIAVSKFLKEQDADFVCLQEVFSSDTNSGVIDFISSLETLQKVLKYPYVYFEPTLSFTASSATAQFGNAILSKYPLSDKKAVFTNNTFQIVDNWEDNPRNTRNIQIAAATLPDGRQFTLANHHGYMESDPLGSEKTVEAMKIAVAELKKVERPLILSGDLNVRSESPAMRLFDNWLEDLTATHNITDTLSQFGKVRNVPCDHILVSADIQVKSFEVSETLVSDHKPLILEFDL